MLNIRLGFATMHVGVGQQWQIRHAVADVIEFTWTKTLAQALELADAGEVGDAVRAQHVAEDAQMPAMRRASAISAPVAR